MQSGTTTLGGWPDAPYGNQPPRGRSRLGYVIGLASSTLKCPRHILRKKSKYTRQLVTSSLAEAVNDFSEMVDHMEPSREFYEPSMDLPPGMVGLAAWQGCKCRCKRLRNKKTVAGQHLVCHFSGIQEALGRRELGDICWSPGADYAAGGLAKIKSAMAPSLWILQSGAFCESAFRLSRVEPLKGDRAA